MDQTNPTPFPAYEKTSSSKRRIAIIVILVLLLIGAGAAGVYYLNAKQSPSKTAMAPTPTTAPTVAPSPTVETSPSPSSTVSTTPAASNTSRKGLTISVLNGSGVSGAAKKAADYLTGLGYTVSSTGNADSDSYTNVSIQMKKSQSKLLPTLKSDLAKQYTIGSTSATLSDSSATDAIVTIGK